MVPMNQKDQRYKGDLIVENVSPVKRKKIVGAVKTACKEYKVAELLLFVPITWYVLWNNSV